MKTKAAVCYQAGKESNRHGGSRRPKFGEVLVEIRRRALPHRRVHASAASRGPVSGDLRATRAPASCRCRAGHRFAEEGDHVIPLYRRCRQCNRASPARPISALRSAARRARRDARRHLALLVAARRSSLHGLLAFSNYTVLPRSLSPGSARPPFDKVCYSLRRDDRHRRGDQYRQVEAGANVVCLAWAASA